MAKLLSIIILVLAIVLFPPAALAVISNNAVPGDTTYPIKRILEDGIYAIASLNPTTKAWFAAARSDRRFKEVEVLATSGKQASQTLNELVEQTQVAASQLEQVKDPAEKEKLKQQLVESIKKYDQGLKQISSSRESNGQQIAQVPSAQNTQPSISTNNPVPQATPGLAISHRPIPTNTPLCLLVYQLDLLCQHLDLRKLLLQYQLLFLLRPQLQLLFQHPDLLQFQYYLLL